jgi:hypothetical protein
MQDFKRPAVRRARRIVAPALAIVALTLSTQAALAITQGKPQLNVETERSPQGAKLTFKGKGWAPSARIKITGTRAPGSSNNQDFGMFSADAKGELTGRKTQACSTTREEDGQNESVTITAVDSATPANKATAKVPGGAWVCQ